MIETQGLLSFVVVVGLLAGVVVLTVREIVLTGRAERAEAERERRGGLSLPAPDSRPVGRVVADWDWPPREPVTEYQALDWVAAIREGERE